MIFGELFRNLKLPLGRYGSLMEQLVIARILHPSSKRETARWLEQYLSSGFSLDQLYRVLDVLHKKRTLIEKALSGFIKNNYPNSVRYLLYDVTTFYFETDKEDGDLLSGTGLRRRGYSKDHRFDMPQIVLGLCVNELGMPLSFKLYPGNTYEGKTLVEGIQKAISNAMVDEVNVVCDAGMLSQSNLDAIEQLNQKFIISARLKSLDAKTTRKIISNDFKAHPITSFEHKKYRLIVSFSETRRRADASRRKKAIARLEKLIEENKVVRRHKFLELNVGKATLNQKAIEEDSRFDGLKGYITNNYDLDEDEVISHYNQLHVVEQSFRMSKSDLKIRPTFHQNKQRIESHVLLCMISLCLMRVLEEKLRGNYTWPKALEVISSTNSAVIGNKKKQYLIPPLLSENFKQIQSLIAS